MENIKLVIWDLDDTFWQGTLSEGGITIIKEHVDIVKDLVARGIMNSVSSKNDFTAVKKELVQIGLWDFFIFPHINWNPKGLEVKNIISQCQLRSENVLLIDDNITNRKEVEFYNKGINTVAEDKIAKLLQMPELKGKDDSNLTRLKQYKVLEKKFQARENYADNYQFLRDSHITINAIKDLKPYKGRILELINRTNQLNFTKVRLDKDDLDVLLNDSSLENVGIRVVDKFGDYGVCGFYSYDKRKHTLNHFLFSCRIMNLGIEQYLFRKLNQPSIEIIAPVSSNLCDTCLIDWIKELDNDSSIKLMNHLYLNRKKMLILGGCDLSQMCHYIDERNFNVIKEFNYVNKKNVDVHKEHTAFLKDSYYCSNSEKCQIYDLPFGDDRMFNTNLFSDAYDILVYSVLMNYTQIVYRKKNADFRVARGGYKEIGAKPYWVYKNSDGTRDEEWIYEGQQSPEAFREDLQWLYDHVKTPIIFINGAETPYINKNEMGACERHVVMNRVLDEFIDNHQERCYLLDVRKLVCSIDDNTNNIRHYQRYIYIKMAEMLMSIVSGSKVTVSKKIILWNKLKYDIYHVVKHIYGFLLIK